MRFAGVGGVAGASPMSAFRNHVSVLPHSDHEKNPAAARWVALGFFETLWGKRRCVLGKGGEGDWVA